MSSAICGPFRRIFTTNAAGNYNESVKSFPTGFDERRARDLLRASQPATAAPSRIERVSAELVGCPYQSNPLIGSAGSPEVFTVGLESFDCVTFIETVLAFAQSKRPDRFLDRLRSIRYALGKVQWNSRNHYMTDWIRNNVRTGAIARIPALKGTRKKDRVLNVVPGLVARRMKFACVPKTDLRARAAGIQTGDLIFFASTRSHLDVFHCGILIRNGTGLMLRHASRSRGVVVEEKLEDFLGSQRMAGVIVVRPAEVS